MADLTDNDIQAILYGIHQTKLSSINVTGDIFHASGIKNFHVSELRSQIELKMTGKGLLWEYTTEKSFKFEAEHDLPITAAAYCMQQLDGCKCAPLHKVEFWKNGVSVIPESDLREEPGFVELRSKLSPLPRQGDTVKVRERFQSPFLGPIYANSPLSRISVGGRSYNAYDGFAVVHRVQDFHLKFVFPEELGIVSVAPLVATFSRTLDYISEDEVARIHEKSLLSTETFNGNFVATLRVDRPMYQYFYGIAWELPTKTESMPNVAPESTEWA